MIVNVQLSIDVDQFKEETFVKTGRMPSSAEVESLIYRMVEDFQDYGIYIESLEVVEED